MKNSLIIGLVGMALLLLPGCINNSPKNMERSKRQSPDYLQSDNQRWEDRNWEQQNEGEALQDWEQ